MSISCAGDCDGNTVFQQVSITAGSGTTAEFGTQAWLGSGDCSSSSSATVTLFQIDASGAMLQYDSADWLLACDPEKQYSKTVSLNAAATSLIFAFYPWTGKLNYHFTNPWVVIDAG